MNTSLALIEKNIDKVNLFILCKRPDAIPLEAKRCDSLLVIGEKS